LFLLFIATGGLVRSVGLLFVNVALNVSAVLYSITNGSATVVYSNITVNNFTCNSTSGTFVNAPNTTIAAVVVNITGLSLTGSFSVANAVKGSVLYVAASSAVVAIVNSNCGSYSVKYLLYFYKKEIIKVYNKFSVLFFFLSERL
jgi:hypothetical protein